MKHIRYILRIIHTRYLASLFVMALGFFMVGHSLAAPLVSNDGASANTKTAIFAGGCFWCMEPPFDKLAGVLSTVSGYSGGASKNPSYKTVSAGGTGHYEVIAVEYDSSIVSYAELLEVFWRNVDPLDGRGQFCDKGSQYLSAIFYGSEQEQRQAQTSLNQLQDSGMLDGKIVTGILPVAKFYPAETYHQDYYTKNPLRYKFYRSRCGRDKRLNALWGKENSDK